ncbi:MAG: aminoacetone oxidase family FAD-binding enzyme [Saccharofermentans sp.]|nr:aminoacetone oxidase family FAD-binding enzyme [Saccharofermentans sp.]
MIGIVGGGSAGLWAACFLKKRGADFILLERNSECGKKLLLTGHGRCNITNLKEPASLKMGYHEASNYIYPTLKKFTPQDAVNFIEGELKIKLKEEDNNRIFPVSDSAKTIRDGLVNYIGKENIMTDYYVTDIKKEDKFILTSKDGRVTEVDTLIIATGGKSFAKTGSDGQGINLAKNLGHDITALYPALVPVRVKEKEFTSSVAGVAVNAGADLYIDYKKKNGSIGDVLFTHNGLSGPVIMNLAREIPEDVETRSGWIELDFTPGRNESEVEAELLESIKNRPEAKVTTLGSSFVPKSVAGAIGKHVGIEDVRGSDLKKEDRRKFVQDIKHMKFTIEGQSSYSEAYVTRGGVSLKNIKRESFESKIVPGLYLIGEMIDVDGISGGYNLQATMSEAYVAVNDIMVKS